MFLITTPQKQQQQPQVGPQQQLFCLIVKWKNGLKSKLIYILN